MEVEIGDYVDWTRKDSKPITGFILAFHTSERHVLLQITKGATFGHAGTGNWLDKNGSIIPYIEGNNRYWVPKEELTLLNREIFYEVY